MYGWLKKIADLQLSGLSSWLFGSSAAAAGATPGRALTYRESENASMEAYRQIQVSVRLDPIQIKVGQLTVTVTGPGLSGHGQTSILANGAARLPAYPELWGDIQAPQP